MCSEYAMQTMYVKAPNGKYWTDIGENVDIAFDRVMPLMWSCNAAIIIDPDKELMGWKWKIVMVLP